MPADLSKYLPKESQKARKTNLDKYLTNRTPTVDTEDEGLMSYAPDILRGIGGFAPGGWIGAAANAATETGARWLEGKPFSLPAASASAAFGAIPFHGVPSVARAALRGLGLSAGQSLAMGQAEQGLHVPTKEDVESAGLSGIVGAAGGAVTAKVLPKVLSKIKSGKTVADPVIKVEEPTVKTPKEKAAEEVSDAVRQAKDIKKPESTIKVDLVETADEVIPVVKLPRDKKGRFVKKSTIDPNVDVVTGRKKTADIVVGDENTPHIELKSEPVKEIKGSTFKPVIESSAEAVPTAKIDEQVPEVSNPETPEKIGWIRRGAREARTAQTAFDASIPFRQGIGGITRPEFWTSLRDMIMDAGREGRFIESEAKRAANPRYAQKINAGLNLTNKEEHMTGTWMEKHVLPIAMSNRAASGFLRKFRSDYYDSLADYAEKAGVDVSSLDAKTKKNINAQAMAEFINDASGSGHLGDFERVAKKMNDFFFSPKFIASRVNMLRRAGQGTIGEIADLIPGLKGKYQGSFLEGVDPRLSKKLRREAIRSMIGVGGMATLGTGLSTLVLGEDASTTADPLSTDFGKIKTGKTRLDLTGGFQQYVRTAAQISTGLARIEGEIKNKNSADTAIRFARNKLSPLASLIADYMYGENPIGEEFNASKAVTERLVPLVVQDLVEIMREDPGMAPYTVPASFFGVGAQSYGKDRVKRGGVDPRVHAIPKVTLPNYPNIKLMNP